MAPRQVKAIDDDADVAPGTEAGVKLPGGIEINTKGYHLGNLLQIVAAAILAVMALMLYDMRESTKGAALTLAGATEKQAAQVATVVKADHEKLFAELDKHNQAQEEMNYILTLTPAERERLRLRMPESLRRKIADR